jgi:hypothetical protein
MVYRYDGASAPAAVSGVLGVGVQDLLLYPMLVGIDIKPGSCPNAINLGAKGVTPVAILGSPAFDVTTVDPSTVLLAGASIKLIGQGKPAASLEDVNGDGYMDLVCRMVTQELLLGDDATSAVLEAWTWGGQLIMGVDSVMIVPH